MDNTSKFSGIDSHKDVYLRTNRNDLFSRKWPESHCNKVPFFIRLDSTGNVIQNKSLPESKMPPHYLIKRQSSDMMGVRNQNNQSIWNSCHSSVKRSYSMPKCYTYNNFVDQRNVINSTNCDRFINELNKSVNKPINNWYFNKVKPKIEIPNMDSVNSTHILGPMWWKASKHIKTILAASVPNAVVVEEAADLNSVVIEVSGNSQLDEPHIGYKTELWCSSFSTHTQPLYSAVINNIDKLFNTLSLDNGIKDTIVCSTESDKSPVNTACAASTSCKVNGNEQTSHNNVDILTDIKCDVECFVDCIPTHVDERVSSLPDVTDSKQHQNVESKKRQNVKSYSDDLIDYYESVSVNKRLEHKSKKSARKSKMKQRNDRPCPEAASSDVSKVDYVNASPGDCGKILKGVKSAKDANGSRGKQSLHPSSCDTVNKPHRNYKKSKLKHFSREPKYFSQTNSFVSHPDKSASYTDPASFPDPMSSTDPVSIPEPCGSLRQKLHEGYIRSNLKKCGEKFKCSKDFVIEFDDFLGTDEAERKCAEVLTKQTSLKVNLSVLDICGGRNVSNALNSSDTDSDWDDSSDDDAPWGDMTCFLPCDDPYNLVSVQISRDGGLSAATAVVTNQSCDKLMSSSPLYDAALPLDVFDGLPSVNMSEKVKSANQFWNMSPDTIENDIGGKYDTSPVKCARFAPDADLTRIHHMYTWSYAYAAARIGPWEQYARDRERFQRRIAEVEDVITPVLRDVHRSAVYARLCTMPSTR